MQITGIEVSVCNFKVTAFTNVYDRIYDLTKKNHFQSFSLSVCYLSVCLIIGKARPISMELSLADNGWYKEKLGVLL